MPSDPARQVADELERRGLAVPARLLADAHRPLAPLLSDLGAGVAPLVRSVFGRRGAGVVALIEDPAALDRLVRHLDADGEANGEPR